MSMDGGEYSVLHDTTAFGLTLDYTNQLLYWTNGDGYIYSSSVDGLSTTEVHDAYYYYYFYSYNSITILNDHLFWLNENNMNQFNLKNGTFKTAVLTFYHCWWWQRPMVAVSKDRQPEGRISLRPTILLLL